MRSGCPQELGAGEAETPLQGPQDDHGQGQNFRTEEGGRQRSWGFGSEKIQESGNKMSLVGHPPHCLLVSSLGIGLGLSVASGENRRLCCPCGLNTEAGKY